MASGALEQSALEAKDRDQLLAIAKALGVKSAGRAKKEEIIGMILEQTAPSTPAPSAPAPVANSKSASTTSSVSHKTDASALGADGQPLSEWEIELAEHEGTPIAPDARRRTEQTESRSDNREFRDNRGPREQREPR
ncbi:MAG: hypothetical protein F2583_07395 [Actinobacteria bacterium]|uniref:Unannotated protein n=1 Tax=freshwater metagenome TaxID=449393 RepID=A0A6J6HGH6_9ZZZZ|nr:hypothetical protein [Actinomycetota bacterium]